MKRPAILLNPGPVTLTTRVRNALLRPDMCHRESDFAQLTLDVRERLARVYPEAASKFDAVLLAGSGTLAVESMLASLLPRDEMTLVVANGVYGERIKAMLAAHDKPSQSVDIDWLQPLPLAEIEARLIADPSIKHVVAVHNETTTGRLNDVGGLGALCTKYGRSLLLDTVSSFGGESIDFDSWHLDAVAATSNKCLHGVPGVAIVLVRRDLFSRRPSAARSLYLDLWRYHQSQVAGFSPFTPAVHSMMALQEALTELADAGGWSARRAVYRSRSQAVRSQLESLGVHALLPADDYSAMITSFGLPENTSYPSIHDQLLEAGFVIYAGQGPLASRCFRIATMGEISSVDLDRLLAALRATFGRVKCAP